jgi:branched-chain amino acid transport system permease protein
MTWQVSGEGLLMAIMGGPQSFLGPVVGAAFFVLVKEQLAGITQEYMIFFGLFFMVVVAVFRDGLAGFVEMLIRTRKT